MRHQTSCGILSLFAFLLIVSCVDGGLVERSGVHSVKKRSLFQMCGLITHYTGSSCLEYNNYGCFCGLGNQGTKPLDDVDNCCRKHDNCYGDVDCFWLYPQWVGYHVQCNATGCQCTDSPVWNSCAYTTCQCDLQFAQCLGDSVYHEYNKNYNRQLCNHRVQH